MSRHQNAKNNRRRRHGSLHTHIGGWLGGLGRRLSLSSSSAAEQREDSNQRPSMEDEDHEDHHEEVVEEGAAAAIAGSSGIQREKSPRRQAELTHRDRHQINLRYHLLRYHQDAMVLCGDNTLMDCDDEEDYDDEAFDDEECLLRLLCNGDDGWSDWEDWESGSDYDGRSSGSSSDGSLAKKKVFGGSLKTCDSDSCLSTCSGCSKRFKHQRRTDRWNQEYDLEFKERNGLLDSNYLRVNQIK